MKKIIEWMLILWISIPLMMEAMQTVVNLENYKIAVGWFLNIIYRKNTYYYIAAAIEVLIVFFIFIEFKRKWMLWLGFLIILTWQIIKPIIIEADRGLSYGHLNYPVQPYLYYLILGMYAILGIFFFYKTGYIKNRN